MASRRYSNLKTTTAQRVGVWMILIVSLIGVVAGSAFMVLQSQNPDLDPNKITAKKQEEEYTKAYEEYLSQQEEYTKTLRALEGYSDKVSAFDAASVTELKVEVLSAGEGAVIRETDTISADYTGWTPDGTIFDSTTAENDGTLANASTSFALNEVISGWTTGLSGQKVGGTYLLSIPSEQAYGTQGNGSIAANTPLKFIVHVASVK